MIPSLLKHYPQIVIMRIAKLAIVFLIFLSCSNENPCDIPRVGDNFTLSELAKSYISNYESKQRVVFVNEIGEEVFFELTDRVEFLSKYVVLEECEVDNGLNQFVEGTSEFIQFSLTNSQEFSDSIYVSLSEIPVPPNNLEVVESLFVSCGEWLSDSYEEGDGLLWIRTNTNSNEDYIILDTLELQGRIFTNVIEPRITSSVPKLDIKYTMAGGIIYIRDPSTNKEYVYDRIE